MKKIIIILILLYSMSYLFGQTSSFNCYPNLVKNGDFEDGPNNAVEDNWLQEGRAFYDYSNNNQFHWFSWTGQCNFGEGSIVYAPNSPDWYNNNFWNLTFSGNRFCGMSFYEMVQQKLNQNLTSQYSYRLSAWIYLRDLNNGANYNDYRFEAHLASFNLLDLHLGKTVYKKIKPGNPATTFCADVNSDPDYFNLKNNTRISMAIPLDNLPLDQWVNVIYYFDGPSSFSAEYLALEFSRVVNGQRTTATGWGTPPYMLLDRIQLTQMCPEVCDRFNVCPNISSNLQINPSTPLIVSGLSGLRQATVQIDVNGNIVHYDTSPFCVNGLDNIYEWDGGGNGPAFYTLRVWGTNGCLENQLVYTNKIQLIDNGFVGSTQGFQCQQNPTIGPNPCCEYEPNIVFTNNTFNSLLVESYHARNRVEAGNNTSNVIVNSTQLVEFVGGNSVRLGERFRVGIGSRFLGRTEPCPDTVIPYIYSFSSDPKEIITETVEEKASMMDGDQNSDIKILVYPNPASNIITIQSFKNPVTNIFLYDTKGSLIKTIATGEGNSITFQVNNLAKGNYFINVVMNERSVYKKIFIE